MIPLSSKRLDNLIAIIIGIIISQSVTVSKIAQELKSSYSCALEGSKIKRIYRFLNNKYLQPENLYEFFIYNFFKHYKPNSKMIYIIFDHTTILDKFLILQFCLKVGKRAIPLWYKVFYYNEIDNKNFYHVKQGLLFLHDVLKHYDYNVTLLSDRGFKSIDLFRFIDEKLKWKYCIRCTKDLKVKIKDSPKIKKLEDIKILKNKGENFFDVELTKCEYKCNLSVCRKQDKQDTWYIANNLDKAQAIREYKKRFEIEEMFKDFKSGGFNLESIGSKNIQYIKMMYLCISISYSLMISIGTFCSKNKKNKQLYSVKNIKYKKVRTYSIFRTGLRWFKRCLYEDRKKYYLKISFIVYE